MDKIIITGGAGFLGRFVVSEFLKAGYPKENIFIPRSAEYDLRKKESIKKMLHNFPCEKIIHLAAKVGGIGYNQKHPAELFYNNLIMGIQLMEEARLSNVTKFVAIGTICAYPKFTPVPFKETQLWNGYPEETNAPYGLAKKMMLVQAQAYRKQYGLNAIFLLPVNLYGPNDNFNPEQSHVIPALIRKIHEAKKNKSPILDVWGTGSPSREFLYVEDAAHGIYLATEKYNKEEPVNLGSGTEITIKDLVNMLCRLMKYNGRINWQKDKPDGQPRRCLDVSKAKEEFGFSARTSLEEGLKRTIKWWEKYC
ncbi:MAG: GDP-L-fucose synthase [archaeon]